jgi:fibronectin type 3 domain-containing protein
VNSIDLAWARNTESDLGGYNVYRSTDGGPFEKIGNLIQTPVFTDTHVESGKHYRYAVSAVDTTGNESARSEPVEPAAP